MEFSGEFALPKTGFLGRDGRHQNHGLEELPDQKKNDTLSELPEFGRRRNQTKNSSSGLLQSRLLDYMSQERAASDAGQVKLWRGLETSVPQVGPRIEQKMDHALETLCHNQDNLEIRMTTSIAEDLECSVDTKFSDISTLYAESPSGLQTDPSESFASGAAATSSSGLQQCTGSEDLFITPRESPWQSYRDSQQQRVSIPSFARLFRNTQPEGDPGGQSEASSSCDVSPHSKRELLIQAVKRKFAGIDGAMHHLLSMVGRLQSCKGKCSTEDEEVLRSVRRLTDDVTRLHEQLDKLQAALRDKNLKAAHSECGSHASQFEAFQSKVESLDSQLDNIFDEVARTLNWIQQRSKCHDLDNDLTSLLSEPVVQTGSGEHKYNSQEQEESAVSESGFTDILNGSLQEETATKSNTEGGVVPPESAEATRAHEAGGLKENGMERLSICNSTAIEKEHQKLRDQLSWVLQVVAKVESREAQHFLALEKRHAKSLKVLQQEQTDVTGKLNLMENALVNNLMKDYPNQLSQIEASLTDTMNAQVEASLAQTMNRIDRLEARCAEQTASQVALETLQQMQSDIMDKFSLIGDSPTESCKSDEYHAWLSRVEISFADTVKRIDQLETRFAEQTESQSKMEVLPDSNALRTLQQEHSDMVRKVSFIEDSLGKSQSESQIEDSLPESRNCQYYKIHHRLHQVEASLAELMDVQVDASLAHTVQRIDKLEAQFERRLRFSELQDSEAFTTLQEEQGVITGKLSLIEDSLALLEERRKSASPVGPRPSILGFPLSWGAPAGQHGEVEAHFEDSKAFKNVQQELSDMMGKLSLMENSLKIENSLAETRKSEYDSRLRETEVSLADMVDARVKEKWSVISEDLLAESRKKFDEWHSQFQDSLGGMMDVRVEASLASTVDRINQLEARSAEQTESLARFRTLQDSNAFKILQQEHVEESEYPDGRSHLGASLAGTVDARVEVSLASALNRIDQVEARCAEQAESQSRINRLQDSVTQIQLATKKQADAFERIHELEAKLSPTLHDVFCEQIAAMKKDHSEVLSTIRELENRATYMQTSAKNACDEVAIQQKQQSDIICNLNQEVQTIKESQQSTKERVMHAEETLLKAISIFKEQQQNLHIRLDDLVEEHEAIEKRLVGLPQHLAVDMTGLEQFSCSGTQTASHSHVGSSQQDATSKEVEVEEPGSPDQRQGWFLFRMCQRRSAAQ